ncbi:MAG: hypothetical protein JXA14_21185, partial [Anaerolineae bacterium]|nr:hypothetical protein [Anaerolineae bacterium]
MTNPPTRPTQATVKRLFAVSGNRCAFPECPNPLIEPNTGSVSGEICHIEAQNANGPRYNPKQTDEERHSFSNLILMCPIHHKVIDDKPDTYTVVWLQDLKAGHEARYAGGREPSDDIARQFLFPAYSPPPPPDPDDLPEPGALPPGSRLPFHRNALFTGRVELMKALARALLHDGAGSTLITQAVQGMGGVGKTQLAVEFAWRYGRYFRGVHWLNAAQPDLLAAEVALCGAEMGLPHWPEEQPEQVRLTLQVWRGDGRYLIILDNLEEVETAREWLPRLGSGGVRLLLTARRSDWPRDLGLGLLRLRVFRPEESMTFLRRSMPEERGSDADLASLAERLGHLPLALQLSGRYLERLPRVTVPNYLEKLDEVLAHPSMAGWR